VTHGLHWAEVLPAAPLLPLLAEVMAYAVAFGICVIAVHFVRALFAPTAGLAAHIPWIGKTVADGVTTIQRKLTGKLEEAVAGLDHRMALAWYKLASTAQRIGHEIMANAQTLASLAVLLGGIPNFADWRAFIKRIHSLIAWTETHAIGAVHTLTRPLTANVSALSRWTRSQVKALRHSIAVTIPGEFAGLRHRTRKVEDAVERDWTMLKRHERLLGIGALTGVVAIALSRLGASWVRCSSARSFFNKRGCNAWNEIDSLLAAAVLIELPFTLELLATVGREVIKDGAVLIDEFR